MSTNINVLVQGLDRRWDEVSLLMSMVEELDYEDPKLTPMCKALTVLMVANLEGYLQEIIRSLIADINDNSYFRNTHYKMKRTQCLQYVPEPKNYEVYINRLITKFDEADTKYDVSAFLFEHGKNPKLSVIERLYESVGGDNFFGHISECELEMVFENDRESITEQIDVLRKHILSVTGSFPYIFDIEEMGFNVKPSKNKGDCLWSNFLDYILKYRNYAAHGKDISPLSVTEIKAAFEKIKVLELLSTVLIVNAAIINNDPK